MPNYSNSKIYKIWSPTHPDEIYIGSTTQPLAKRMGEHRSYYKRYQAGNKKYYTCFKILAYEDSKIELIEKHSCKCREELLAREGHYIRTLDCVNKFIPDRTKKEWYEDNKGDILEHQKQYRQKNKEKIKARDSEKTTCECGVSLTRGNLARHKKSNKHLQALKTTT